MAAVIGSARTLQQRWRELSAEQRDAFLALIADETDRLAALVGEVLDSSRIDAGTFSYAFAELDLGMLVNETVAAASLGHDDVRLVAELPPEPPDCARRPDPAPPGADEPDRQRRQVLTFRLAGRGEGERRRRPGERRRRRPRQRHRVEDQRLIFEKFGRVRGTSFKPGTGLGLYIARAIAEAHGGTLEVSSTPGEGSTFTLMLPSVLTRRRSASRRESLPPELPRSSSRARWATRARAARAARARPPRRGRRAPRRRATRCCRPRARESAEPSTSGRAPFSTSQRATAGEYQMRAVVAWCSSERSKPSRGMKPRRSSFALRVRSRR